ncbi:site-specific DNA-methyltransferase [Pseudomonas sp. PDM08]|uniref:site-specific DNA-methyltransferase n=1 Tax=Pseudomonas sp. PDM08 TaxID=2769265 RepID=UPI00177D2DA2|nr:site-specific DNA-methyltransferase [Pseudomonas sp. PDM08]MBD9607424.1 site-specific DNA-methyltransferase [Pseudomonas sp. PDM08]
MDKLKMHSLNLTEANIDKLAELFPHCITEAQDDNGKLRKAIDFDLLRQELSSSIVEGPQERYQLNWPGKREALLTANAPIAKTLRPFREESVDFDNTQNLFIEGDNLDALKLLQESYLNQVKVIYIDPPYNTGNDFIYDDDFSETVESYLERSAQVSDSGGRLVANTDSNGRFHSDWVTMIYSRLKLARNLLRDDGIIFISIDDGEVSNLRKVCDEIFGESNFVADVTWQKRYTRSNNTIDFTTVVEHIICYSKTDQFVVNLLPRTEDADARYTNPDNDPRGVWKGASFLNPATPKQRPNLCYPITNPNTKEVTYPTTNAWRRSESEFNRIAAENRLYWGVDGRQKIPSIKMFLSEARGLTPINFWSHEYAGNTDQGTAMLESLMGGKVFNNPKPVSLLVRVLEHSVATNDIVLDFFSGSGTTAHAVMAYNAEKNCKLRYIAVQLPEIAEENSTAFSAGYKNIAEIGKERIRRAGNKIKQENVGKEGIDQLDTGFRVLKIDTSNMKEVYYAPDEVTQDQLPGLVNNIREDRTSEDLLFQVLLDWGVDLALPICQQTIAGKTVYFVDGNALVACFETGIDEAFVKQLAEHKPLRVVFRDSGFASDSVKINVEQVFKLLSRATEVKTI